VKKERKIERLIRLAWESLETHLDGTYLKTPEGIAFHKKCVRDYSEMIKLLSELM